LILKLRYYICITGWRIIDFAKWKYTLQK